MALLALKTGTHTEGTTTGVAVWGTNRFGDAFSGLLQLR